MRLWRHQRDRSDGDAVMKDHIHLEGAGGCCTYCGLKMIVIEVVPIPRLLIDLVGPPIESVRS